MKNKIIIALIFLLLLTVGYTSETKAWANKARNANIQRFYADLNGDRTKKLVEVENKTATDSKTVVTVKNNKKSAAIDSFSIPGKIREIQFKDLNFDSQERIIVSFDDQDNISHIVVYQLNNNKLSKIFSASSAFGIETDFVTASRIKVGKASARVDSFNLIPDWDTWVWVGDKFIKE